MIGLRYTISALDGSRCGVLIRVAGLFTRRGRNIASLSAGPAETPDLPG